MLTPADHALLASYTALPSLTQAQAEFINNCMRANSWLDKFKVTWHYPVDDVGYPIEGHQRYQHPISRPTKAGAKVNPASISQQQPWVALNISRAQWYARRNLDALLLPYRCQLPSQYAEDQVGSLKLYQALNSLALTHKLDIKVLWGKVAKALEEMEQPEPKPGWLILKTVEEQRKDEGV